MAPTSRGGGGKLSRRTALLMIGGGGLMAVSGTGAFSQVNSNRQFSVSSASDSNALLKLEGLKDGETYQEPHKVTVTNKFGYELTDNTISTGAGNLKVKSSKDSPPENEIQVSPIDSEENQSFFVVAESEQSGKKQGTISVAYSGTGGKVELSRDIVIEAETDDPNDCSGIPIEIKGEKKDNIDTSRTVEVRTKGEIVNDVIADGCVLLFNNAVVKGSVNSGGKVHLRNNSEIKESVEADGNVILEQKADIKNVDKKDISVDTDGSVTLKNKATITGNVKAKGDITISNQAEIKGDATTGGEFDIKGKGEVKGKRRYLNEGDDN